MPARAGYDRAYRQRKRGIYVLAGVCVAFFVVVISTCHIAAAKYGYGTGFGDGKELLARIPRLGGTGFWGDVAVDMVILFVWYLPRAGWKTRAWTIRWRRRTAISTSTTPRRGTSSQCPP